jgi:hypothetical protein
MSQPRIDCTRASVGLSGRIIRRYFLVAAMQEPGVGKSRLFYEFKAVAQSGWVVIETVPVSHARTARTLRSPPCSNCSVWSKLG